MTEIEHDSVPSTLHIRVVGLEARGVLKSKFIGRNILLREKVPEGILGDG
jgi:hypothetical protein